ncbi:MAG: hypothetical protein QG658_94 [Patescibacteria group bacterium]|nr:hypothetical protein [Patescibacteria group bacterium]
MIPPLAVGKPEKPPLFPLLKNLGGGNLKKRNQKEVGFSARRGDTPPAFQTFALKWVRARL